MDRDVTGLEQLDLCLVDIQAQHIIAQVREAGAGHKSDVTGSDDGDLHVSGQLVEWISQVTPISDGSRAVRQRIGARVIGRLTQVARPAFSASRVATRL